MIKEIQLVQYAVVYPKQVYYINFCCLLCLSIGNLKLKSQCLEKQGLSGWSQAPVNITYSLQ